MKVEREVKATLARMVSRAGLATMKVCPLLPEELATPVRQKPSGRYHIYVHTDRSDLPRVGVPIDGRKSGLIDPLTRFRERLRS